MKSAAYVIVSHGSLVCRQYIIWTQMATLIFTLRAGRTVWKSHFRKVYCTMARSVARWARECLMPTLIKLLTIILCQGWGWTGVLPGWLTLLGISFWGYDASSVGSGPPTFRWNLPPSSSGWDGPQRIRNTITHWRSVTSSKNGILSCTAASTSKFMQVNWC